MLVLPAEYHVCQMSDIKMKYQISNIKNKMSNIKYNISPSKLIPRRLYMYTAERRDVLGCTSPTTKRFPEAREMSRGRSPRDISRTEGNLEVVGDVQPNTSLLSAVYAYIIEAPNLHHISKIFTMIKNTISKKD